MKNPVPPVSRVRVADPEQLAGGILGAHLAPCQLSPEPCASELARVMLPGGCLDMVHLGPAMLFSGAMTRDCYTLVFVLDCPQPGRSFNFAVEHTDGYMGFFAPGGTLDAVTPAGYRNATLSVPVAQFDAALALRGAGVPDRVLARGAGLSVPPDAQAPVRALVAMFQEMMRDAAQPLASEEVRHHAGRSLQAAFVDALAGGCEHASPRLADRAARRHQRLRQARDYMAAHVGQPVYLEALCGATGLNSRALENLFRDLLGISPTAYLRHQRLHGVHRTLQHSTPASGIVKQTALSWGFGHMGHFARDYRALFGESPSATVARAGNGNAASTAQWAANGNVAATATVEAQLGMANR